MISSNRRDASRSSALAAASVAGGASTVLRHHRSVSARNALIRRADRTAATGILAATTG